MSSKIIDDIFEDFFGRLRGYPFFTEERLQRLRAVIESVTDEDPKIDELRAILDEINE